MRIPLIAWLTLQEARRRKLLWVGVVLGLAFLFLFGVGYYFMYRDISRQMGPNNLQMREVSNFFIMAGLYAANFLVVMVSVLASVDTISGEIASHSIQSVVTKPLRRWEVVLGKWVGFAAIVAGCVLFLGGGVVAIGWVISRHAPPNLLSGMGLMTLEGLILLTVTILGGTRLSTLANGVVAFMLFGLAFIGGWTEQIGSLIRNEAAVNVGIVSSLIIPTEALWKRAAYLMQPPALASLGITPFSATSVPSPAMIGYAILYTLVALTAALYLFERRDL
ncbi:MAG: ABC transporter permease subunit [Anaerolineae bacterium]|nr:ABC transporter permease subunit [Anaerolineae bacterium]